MFCSRCGGQVGENQKFCQVCGQPVGSAATPAPAAPPSPVEVSVPVYAAPPIPPPAVAYTPSPPVSAAAVAPLPYGGFWERVGAYLIDGLILGIPFGIVMVALIVMFGGFGVMLRRVAGQPQPDPRAVMAMIAPIFMLFFIWMAVFLILQWLYFAGMESSPRQATIGKSMMSLRVTNYEGQRISFGNAHTAASSPKIVSGMVPLAHRATIMAAFTARKQALHDLIAGTLVLRKRNTRTSVCGVRSMQTRNPTH